VPATEDILTPIHKGIRSMIYDLGRRLQATDFGDPSESNEVVGDLQFQFATSPSSGCLLCLLHRHGGDEETGAFPALRRFEPALVDELLRDHLSITRRLATINRFADDLDRQGSRAARVAVGIELNREANGLFAEYLAHMNKEEVTFLPALQRHFTDEQLRGMRSEIQAALGPERLAQYLRWTLPSLNASELTSMLQGMARTDPPEAVAFVCRIAEANVPPARWNRVRAAAGV